MSHKLVHFEGTIRAYATVRVDGDLDEDTAIKIARQQFSRWNIQHMAPECGDFEVEDIGEEE